MCLAFVSFAVCGMLTAAALQVHGAAAVALQLRLAVSGPIAADRIYIVIDIWNVLFNCQLLFLVRLK